MKGIRVVPGVMKETLPINHTNSRYYEKSHTRFFLPAVALAAFILIPWIVPGASAAALPGGTLDPLTIPKYVTPLVIPPVMNNNGTPNSYDIAVRQFQQQILPGGIWNTLNGGRMRSADDRVELRPGGGPHARGGAGPRFPVQLSGLHDRDDLGYAGRRPMDQRPGGRKNREVPPPPAPDRPDLALGEPVQALHRRNVQHGLPGLHPGAVHRPGADHHPRPRIARRAPQRRLPGGVVPARRDQHPRELRQEGQALRRRDRDQSRKSRLCRFPLSQRPARDHPLVSRPRPRHDPLQRVRRSRGLLARPRRRIRRRLRGGNPCRGPLRWRVRPSSSST